MNAPQSPTNEARPTLNSTILTVDDDTSTRTLFRSALERYGYQVTEAVNGLDGIDKLNESSPDLMLVDLNMPVKDGMEVLEYAREHAPDIPVIIVSGTGNMQDAIKALRLGAWDYLTKPIANLNAFIHTIEINLDRSRLIQQNKQVRLALEQHLKKIREDEEAGRKIQAKLFPPGRWKFGNYRFQHRVFSSMLLSGDFVDYFAVNETTAVFYCADVSGHGVSSALVTVLIKSLISKYLERYQGGQDKIILEPDQLLTHLNKDMLQEQLEKHITIFYGVLNTESRTLLYSTGGQYPPPILFDGSCRFLDSKSIALGLFPFAVFKKEVIALPEAFRLLVFSDGILDALPQAGTAQKLDFLSGLRTDAAITKVANSFSSNDQLPDDITILSLKTGDIP